MHRPDRRATQAHWDQMAEGYDAAKQRNRAYYDALKQCFDQAVPLAARGRVLEIGCGTGQILAFLRPLNGVGIDVSEKMIQAAKQQFADRRELTFAAMDAESGAAAGLGKLGAFDAVISADVMEHVADWRTVLDAMVGACHVGGVIAITTPNPRWAIPLWILERTKLKMPEGPHCFVNGRAIARELADRYCDVRQVSSHLLVPLRLRRLGPRISKWAERAPVLRGLGVIQMIVAEKRAAQ
jgi:2-polyprenyl-3-methyl-5-hydroxy-6-metoxy-1,4-benzoquinol methylase